MTYDDIASRHHGGYLYVIEIDISGQVRRYSSGDLTIPGVGLVQGRVIRCGQVDRALGDVRRRHDVTVEIADVDGAVVSLFAFEEEAANILRADVSLKRGAADLPFADWQLVAMFTFAELIEITDAGTARIRLRGEGPRPNGSVEVLAENEVFRLLRGEYPEWFSGETTMFASIQEFDPVPWVFGSTGVDSRFSVVHFGDWPALPDYGADQWGQMAILGLSPFGFQIDEVLEISPQPAGIVRTWGGYSPGDDGFAQFWLPSIGAYALCLKVHFDRDPDTWAELNDAGLFTGEGGSDLFSGAPIRALNHDLALSPSTDPVSPPTIPDEPLPYSVRDAGQAVIEATADGSWSEDVYEDAWDEVAGEYRSVPLTRALYDTETTVELLSQLGSDLDCWIYQRRDNRLGVARLPSVDVDESAEPVQVIKWEQRIGRGARARLPTDGIGALANVVVVAGMEDLAPRNEESIERHQREGRREITAHWFGAAPSGAAAQRVLGLYANPRWTLHLPLEARATLLELGDIVEVEPGFLPIWAEPRRCLVTRMVEDMDAGTVELTVVDFEDAISLRLYRVNEGNIYTVASGGGGTTLDVIGQGECRITVAVGDAQTMEGILQSKGDVLCIRTAANRVNARIDTVTQIDDWTADVFVSDAGGCSLFEELEEDATAWEISRSYDNRLTSAGHYDAPDDRFGFTDSDWHYGGA